METKEKYEKLNEKVIEVLDEHFVKQAIVLMSDKNDTLSIALKGKKEDLKKLVINAILNNKHLSEVFVEAVDYALQVIERENEQTKVELAQPLLSNKIGEC